MSAIRFEEPAHQAMRSDASLTALIEALRTRPGTWALLGQYSTPGTMRQTAYEIRHGLRRHFAQGQFETESQTMFGEYRVYIRYSGGEES
ncbi:hypothetical protein ACFVHR_04555 [Streptomyces sp. NPDC127168]|uniref:hypothetical protein n=1 Tax=unclassified Streptomyces TaxID=2593676 RepID=UPI0036351375